MRFSASSNGDTQAARAIAGFPEHDLDRLQHLVQAMAAGDPEGLPVIYKTTIARLLGNARAILGSKEDAEEMICNVYMYAWQHAITFDRGRENVKEWLTVIKRNCAIDHRSQRQEAISLDTLPHRAIAELFAGAPHGPKDVPLASHAGTSLHRAPLSISAQRKELLRMPSLRP